VASFIFILNLVGTCMSLRSGKVYIHERKYRLSLIGLIANNSSFLPLCKLERYLIFLVRAIDRR